MEASREFSRTPRCLSPCSNVSVLQKTRMSHFWDTHHRSDVSIIKMSLSGRLETAQSESLHGLPSMHVFFLHIVYVFLPLPDWVSLSPRLPTPVPRFLPSISYVPSFVLSYRCFCFLVFFSLDILSSRLMWAWIVRHVSRSLCLVRGTTSRLAPPLVLLPPLVHGQL